MKLNIIQTLVGKWRDWPIRNGVIKVNGNKKNIFFRGEINERLLDKSLTVVGSRRMTRYGQNVIERFMPELVANKTTIISGFMYGVDTQAHRQCLELGGKTIAVLGCGLNYLTPIENDDLYTNILETGGAVISEYESEFKATVWSFPQRDRILAGMSTLGVLVIEAGIKSGSLITARIAKENNVKIWSVPGPITSSVSEGTNWLIKEKWAEITTEPEQITQIKMIQENLLQFDLPNDQKVIYELLRVESLSIDELSRKVRKSVSELGITISMMSLSGTISEESGKFYLKS